MKKLLALIFMVPLALIGEGKDHPIIVSAAWLNEHKADPDLVILQVSGLRFEYDNEHIAGARYLWPSWLAPDSPEGAMNAPDAKKATETLQSLGISSDSHVVVCHMRNEVSPAARMFLSLENLGLRGQVSFLNGGLEAWKKEGYPVTKDVPVVKKGNFKATPGSLLVDKNYVLKTIQSTSGLVVDARAQRFYDGEPTGNPRDGHIAGAKNIPYQEMIDQSNNTFKPSDQLQPYFSPVSGKDKELVTYCFIGQTASVVYMAGRILGYDMKLYDGSMQEWSRIDTLPMEKTQK